LYLLKYLINTKIYELTSESALDYLYENWVRKEELERWV